MAFRIRALILSSRHSYMEITSSGITALDVESTCGAFVSPSGFHRMRHPHCVSWIRLTSRYISARASARAGQLCDNFRIVLLLGRNFHHYTCTEQCHAWQAHARITLTMTTVSDMIKFISTSCELRSWYTASVTRIMVKSITVAMQ